MAGKAYNPLPAIESCQGTWELSATEVVKPPLFALPP